MSKISVIGRGVDPARHLSISALQVLRKADKVLGIESEREFWNELRSDFNIPDIEDLASLYKSQDRDLENYNRFVDYVYYKLSEFNHIALLIPGHPRFGVSFIELLRKRAPSDLQIEIIDGISSFDAMITYLEIDPLEQGTVLVDANRLLLFQYAIEPSLSYFIYHVSSIGNSQTNFLDPAPGNQIGLLRNYLLKFYQESKEVVFCRIANGIKERSGQIQSRLGDIESLVNMIDYSTTLYIPSEYPKRVDRNYLNLLWGKNES